jgi:DNA recombination protein RmuC
MPAVVYLLIGLAAGALPCLAMLFLLRRGSGISQPLAELERRLSESFSKANLDMAARVEQIKGDLRTDLGDRLQEKFDQLRESQTTAARDARTELADSLRNTTAELRKRFESLENKTAQSLETIRGKVDERLQSMSEQVQQKLEKNIQEGFAHFQKVQDHLKAAEEQLRNVGAVGQSINELNSLLKLPHLRGKFGEAEMGKLLADFLPAGAFEEQATIVPDSKETVDAVIKFPQARLPIDSKFNREQVLPLFETTDPQALKDARKQLAVVIKQQAQSISEKYIHPEHGTTDLALMFVPSETLYFEVIRNVELCESLHKLKVFPVSPNTLAITLKSIAMSFGFYEFAKNVEKTLEQIKQAQRSFGLFQKKFEEVGKGLEKAQQAYGTAAGHLNRYTNKVGTLTGETALETREEPAAAFPSPESEKAGQLLLKSADGEPA